MDSSSTSTPSTSASPRGMGTFTVIWFGQFVSTFGSALTAFALSVWLYEETHSTTLYALNLLAQVLPGILLSPLAGGLVDRINRRLVMILADTGAGLTTLAVAILLATGRLDVWHIYIITFLNAAFSSFQWPAYSAVTTLLVPSKHLGRAGGMNQTGEAISRLLAPALAGALYLVIGVSGVILIDFATFGVAVLTLLFVRVPQPAASEESGESSGSLWDEMLFGFRYIGKRPGFLGLLIYISIFNLAWGIGYSAMMPMLLEMASPDVVGRVSSLGGAGMLIGSLVMSAWGGPRKRVPGLIIFGLLEGLCIILIGVTPTVAVIAAGFGLLVLLNSGPGVLDQAIWQSKVAPDVQGRVFAARRMVMWATLPVAYLSAGPLVDHVFGPLMVEGGALAGSVGQVIGVGAGRGAGLLIVLMGLLVVSASVCAISHPRIRRLEAEIPDVEIFVNAG